MGRPKGRIQPVNATHSLNLTAPVPSLLAKKRTAKARTTLPAFSEATQGRTWSKPAARTYGHPGCANPRASVGTTRCRYVKNLAACSAVARLDLHIATRSNMTG